MNRNVFFAAEKFNMLSLGDNIIIGLSGGADSVCLTHALYALKNELNLTLTAVHINHGIRGEEALRDENFCKQYCNRLDIPLKTFHFDIPSESKKTGESEEECGRRIRYECFNKTANGNSKIATAHNLNDSAETVMLNIVRGTGNKGLCGIPPVRGNIIRPLILTSREEIEDYCKKNSLPYVTDSTNNQNEYKRNIIRNSVMPLLKEMNPSVLTAFSRLVDNASDDEKILSDIANAQYIGAKTADGISVEKLRAMPRAVMRRVLLKFLCEENNIDASYVNIDDIEKIIGTDKKITVSGNNFVFQKNKSLVIATENIDKEPFSVDFDIDSQCVAYPYGTIKVQSLNQKDLQNLNKELLDNAIDCDKIINALILRSRAAGDSFTSAVRNNTKTLKKLFNELKIPADIRNCIPVVASGDEVVWVDSLGTSKKFRVSKNSRKIIVIYNISGVK